MNESKLMSGIFPNAGVYALTEANHHPLPAKLYARQYPENLPCSGQASSVLADSGKIILAKNGAGQTFMWFSVTCGRQKARSVVDSAFITYKVEIREDYLGGGSTISLYEPETAKSLSYAMDTGRNRRIFDATDGITYLRVAAAPDSIVGGVNPKKH